MQVMLVVDKRTRRRISSILPLSLFSRNEYGHSVRIALTRQTSKSTAGSVSHGTRLPLNARDDEKVGSQRVALEDLVETDGLSPCHHVHGPIVYRVRLGDSISIWRLTLESSEIVCDGAFAPCIGGDMPPLA